MLRRFGFFLAMAFVSVASAQATPPRVGNLTYQQLDVANGVSPLGPDRKVPLPNLPTPSAQGALAAVNNLSDLTNAAAARAALVLGAAATLNVGKVAGTVAAGDAVAAAQTAADVANGGLVKTVSVDGVNHLILTLNNGQIIDSGPLPGAAYTPSFTFGDNANSAYFVAF